MTTSVVLMSYISCVLFSKKKEYVFVKEEDGRRERVRDSGLGDVYYFFQAEDGIRGLVRSRWLGDVYLGQYHSRYRTSSEWFS